MNSFVTVEKQPGIWTETFAIITIINALAFLGFNMATAGMPAYLSSTGSKEILVGLATTFSALVAIAIRPFAGYAINRLSSKNTVAIGLILMSVPTLLFIRIDIRFILVLRICHGLGWGLASTGCSTLIAQVVPRARLSEGIGYSGAISSVATAIAPTVAIALLEEISNRAMMISIGTIILLALILLLKFKSSSEKVSALSNKINANNFFETNAIIPALLVFFITVSYSPIITFVIQFAKDNKIDNIYLFFIGYALTTIISRPLTGIFSDKYGCTIPAAFSLLFALASVLLLYFSCNMYVFCLAGIFSGASTGVGMNSLQTMALKKSLPNRRGVAMSTFLFGFDMGMAVGAAIAGLITNYLGYRSMYGIIALFPVVGLTLFAVISRQVKITD